MQRTQGWTVLLRADVRHILQYVELLASPAPLIGPSLGSPLAHGLQVFHVSGVRPSAQVATDAAPPPPIAQRESDPSKMPHNRPASGLPNQSLQRTKGFTIVAFYQLVIAFYQFDS